MATHSSTLAWKIPWMEEPGGLQSTRHQSGVAESDTTEPLHSKVSSHFLFANKAFEHRVLLQDTNYMFKLLQAGGPGSSLAALSPIYLPPQLFSP